MSNGTLVVHSGGWDASLEDVYSVEVPQETDSYRPIPYRRVIDEVKADLHRFDLELKTERYALARDGQRLFGVLTVNTAGVESSEFALAVGIRSSYDKSFPIGLSAGSNVFCCDNLSFSGEVMAKRRQTANVERDLPAMTIEMLSKVGAIQGRVLAEIEAFKNFSLTDVTAHHLMIQAVEAGACPVSMLLHVIREYQKPQHEEFKDRTGWSLFNSFTEVYKRRAPLAQMEDTMLLTKVFAEEMGLRN